MQSLFSIPSFDLTVVDDFGETALDTHVYGHSKFNGMRD